MSPLRPLPVRRPRRDAARPRRLAAARRRGRRHARRRPRRAGVPARRRRARDAVRPPATAGARGARLFGQGSYIYEAGACVVLDGEEHWLTGELLPGEQTIAEQIERPGRPTLLLERYRAAWSTTSRGTRTRGLAPVPRARRRGRGRRAARRTQGHGDLRLVDNGVISARSPDLAALDHVRCYHLVPGGASKARAGSTSHRRARGYAREETIAVGDSREDLACAGRGRTFLAGAQRRRARPVDREALAAHPNVTRRRGRPRRRASTRRS